MGVNFYPSFDVCRIDAQGLRVTLALEDVEVYNVTADVSEGQLTSNAFGIVEEGGFTSTVGDVIRVSHLTYPETVHFTLTLTQDEAYTTVENDVSAYIVEDLSGSVDSPSAAAYFIDLDNPDIPPLYLGDVFPGTNTLAYTTPIAKNGEIRIFSKADTLQTSGNDFRTAEGASIFVPAISPTGLLCIFDHFTDVTTSGTTQELLDTEQIDAGRFAVNGDKIVCEYSGVFAPTITEKILIVSLAGTDIFDSTEFGAITDNATHWSIEFTAIRVSNTVVRVTSELITVNAPPFVRYSELTGLDLTTTDYDLILYGITPDVAGDLTLKMGYGLFIPASTTGTNEVTFMGETVTFDGDEVTFS